MPRQEQQQQQHQSITGSGVPISTAQINRRNFGCTIELRDGPTASVTVLTGASTADL